MHCSENMFIRTFSLYKDHDPFTAAATLLFCTHFSCSKGLTAQEQTRHSIPTDSPLIPHLKSGSSFMPLFSILPASGKANHSNHSDKLFFVGLSALNLLKCLSTEVLCCLFSCTPNQQISFLKSCYHSHTLTLEIKLIKYSLKNELPTGIIHFCCNLAVISELTKLPDFRLIVSPVNAQALVNNYKS